MAEGLVNDVLKRGTRWEEKDVWLFNMLTDCKLGQENIEILVRPYPDENHEFDYSQKMIAAHINYYEWYVLKRFCKAHEKQSDEGDEFKFSIVNSLDQVYFVPCRTPQWLSETTKVQGNQIHSDADVNGTMAGAKAQNLYIFWIKEWQAYGIIYHSYWCV